MTVKTVKILNEALQNLIGTEVFIMHSYDGFTFGDIVTLKGFTFDLRGIGIITEEKPHVVIPAAYVSVAIPKVLTMGEVLSMLARGERLVFVHAGNDYEVTGIDDLAAFRDVELNLGAFFDARAFAEYIDRKHFFNWLCSPIDRETARLLLEEKAAGNVPDTLVIAAYRKGFTRRHSRDVRFRNVYTTPEELDGMTDDEQREYDLYVTFNEREVAGGTTI